MLKTARGDKCLWSHCTNEASKQVSSSEVLRQSDPKAVDERKWQQEGTIVLFIIQISLETSIIEAYSYCESAMELWDTLHKVYRKSSNLNERIRSRRPSTTSAKNKWS